MFYCYLLKIAMATFYHIMSPLHQGNSQLFNYNWKSKSQKSYPYHHELILTAQEGF